jgi:hypothetical protein
MKPTHHHDTKAYHDYYIHQAAKGYPVFAGRRYQRGHGLGSIFGGLFKAIRMSWGVQVPFLSENIIRCVPLLSLSMSGLFFAWQVLL